MRSKTHATLGWGVVWGALGLSKLGAIAPSLRLVCTLAAMPAVLGLAYALATLRARRAWVFMASIAVFANGSVLALPWIFGEELSAAFGH